MIPSRNKQNLKDYLAILPYNIFVWVILFIYMLPIGFMIVTALKPTPQITDAKAPIYPARITTFSYQGEAYQIYNVSIQNELKQLALVTPGQKESEFIDPQQPEAASILWQGNWRQLEPVYEFSPTWENFLFLTESLPLPQMAANTLWIIFIGEIGVLISSIVIAYGFSRFSLPGGNFLFYVLIATILIPEKIIFIPTYFYYVNTLGWKDTLYPILLPLFFGNAIYIFLLRQNFKSIPIELEEAAMIDGAGPIRRLFSIVLPQSWPVIITVALLHFFFTWNDVRLSSLYLSANTTFMPIAFGIQNFQSRIRIDNVIQAGTLLVLLVPIIVLFLSQRIFMQGLVVTGTEKK